MQNFQSKNAKQMPRSRMLVAMLATLSMLATLGLNAPPADAQGSAQFVFQGAGWGHGVGMSQNGARNAANLGLDHVAILNFYYPNTVVSPSVPLETIRVHLGDAPRVELTSEGAITFEKDGVAINSIPSGAINISAHDGGLQIGNAWTTASPTNPVFVSFPQPVKVSNNGHRYLWGKFQLTNRDGEVRVVEVLPFEQYVQGIAEMPAAWPLEALMAQAIAARTYAHEVTMHRRTSLEWAQEYDISGTTVDQNYIGYDAQDSAWDQKWLAAVKATAGVEIVDSNGPVRAYYSATNGGYTETAAYVFGNDVPYTVAGPDPYDAGGHDWTEWTRVYSQAQMSRWTNAQSDTAVGTVTAINLLDGAGASARIDKAVVEIVGTNGTKRITGKRLMLVINAGVFGEGGGLSTHLPGTFTTIGNGIGAGTPQPTGVSVAAVATPDPVPEGTSENAGFVPPPGWEPEPGTGVPPGSAVAPVVAGDTADDAATDALEGASSDEGFVPPEGWEPEPGTGVPPGQAVAPTPTGDADSDATNTSAAEAEADAGDVTSTSADGSVVVPEGWEPEPGTGVPPGQAVAPTATDTATASAEAQDAAEPASTDAGVELPEGWEPEPGTGVPPGQPVTPDAANDNTVGGTGGGDALASGVFLVTRTVDGAAVAEANFEVVAPAEDLAAEARERLRLLQERAALGLFADVDVNGFVASVAPRPVHGVCTATDVGVTCVPLATFDTATTD